MWQGWEPLNMPTWEAKNYPEKPRISSGRSSAPLCLPSFWCLKLCSRQNPWLTHYGSCQGCPGLSICHWSEGSKRAVVCQVKYQLAGLPWDDLSSLLLWLAHTACFRHNLAIPHLRGSLGGYSAIPCDTGKHKAIDYSDSIARLENSHGRATKDLPPRCRETHILSGPKL